jgi:ferritin-like metal-binding protein YciE
VFERFNTPEEFYNYRLGAALEMERAISVELLGSHLEESRAHAPAVESAFSLMGREIDDSPCQVIDAFEKESEAHIKKAEVTIVDSIILQGAAEIERYEIGVCENLIVWASAMSRPDVTGLLRRNMESERTALGRIMTLQTELASVRGGSI